MSFKLLRATKQMSLAFVGRSLLRCRHHLKAHKFGLIGWSCALITSGIIGSRLQYNNMICDNICNILQLKRAQMLSKDTERPSKAFNFIADVAEEVSSAVVFIEVKGVHPFFNQMVSLSSGSGFLVDANGLVLTNAHVVANHKRVNVHLNDGRVVEGVVEFVDQQLDMATIRINLKDLPFIKLGDSRKIRPGEWVIAMGSPFSLSNTITVGVVSTAHRASRELGLQQKEMDYIQTDAPINIGNSGGPLVNLDGEAIGINTMKVTAGISFAIPSNYAVDFLKKCESQRSKSWFGNKGSGAPIPTRKRYIGITMLTLTPTLIEQFKAREDDFPDVTHGIFIWKVVVGSAAHLEGLLPGDIIIKINGKKAESAKDIYVALEEEKPIKLTIRRKEREHNLVVLPEVVE